MTIRTCAADFLKMDESKEAGGTMNAPGRWLPAGRTGIKLANCIGN